MIRYLKLIVTVGIAAFLALSPPWILDGLARGEYRAYWARPVTQWHGKIELWHVAGFRAYQGSVTTYLEARADAYCKRHPGVHIEVTGLTPERFHDRMARGVFPDAYSFPSGLLYAERLRDMPFGEAAFRGALAPAVVEGAVYAVPYLLSGYCLAVNTQRLAQCGDEMPETADAAFLQRALSDAAGRGLSIPPVLGARLALSGEPAESAAFTKGNALAAVLDARAYGDLVRGKNASLLLDAVPCAPYSDEVLYLGAAADADDKRAEIVADFAAYLLSEEEQHRLSGLGALPVVETETPVQYADAFLSALNEAYASPAVPEPFALERHGEALTEEAADAMRGDDAARTSFFERMAVVERGLF